VSYELNAEGTNGVRLETTVVALPGFASEFGISVWNVDATAAPSIDAIWGFTSRGAVGVRGRSTLNGVGVRGEVTSGTGDGVQGQGSGNFSGVAGFGGDVLGGQPGTGVFGMGGTVTGSLFRAGAPGIRGIGGGGPNTSPSNPVGVYGQGGTQSPGVVGQAGSEPADGVQGFGSGNFSGVAGFGGSGTSGDGTGLFGQGGGATGPGVRGIGAGAANTSPSTAVGVYGQGAPDADGVRGVGGGVEGGGVHGISRDLDGNGVIGEANNGVEAYAIWGQSISGFAGVFDGTVQVNGALNVTGAKSAVVPFPDGSHRRLYSMESPESWFEDFGVGHLVNGQAEVQLADDFASVVNSESYHVFVTEYEDNNALYVTTRTRTGFCVRAKSSNTATGTFSYRVVAKRKDIVGERLEKVLILPKKRPAWSEPIELLVASTACAATV
jgi:hypothetical protein